MAHPDSFYKIRIDDDQLDFDDDQYLMQGQVIACYYEISRLSEFWVSHISLASLALF